MHFQAQPTMQADMLDLGTHCNDQHAQPTDLPDLGMHCNDRHAQTDRPTDRPTDMPSNSQDLRCKDPGNKPCEAEDRPGSEEVVDGDGAGIPGPIWS